MCLFLFFVFVGAYSVLLHLLYSLTLWVVLWKCKTSFIECNLLCLEFYKKTTTMICGFRIFQLCFRIELPIMVNS